VQFRPIGIERPGEELAPEGAEFGDNLRKAGAAGPGSGQGRARCHDAALLFIMRGFRAQNAVFDAENEISPDSLKEGFNCRDLRAHGFDPVIIGVNGWKTRGVRLRFGGTAVTSAAAKFP
jgi:hypothetical protein